MKNFIHLGQVIKEWKVNSPWHGCMGGVLGTYDVVSSLDSSSWHHLQGFLSVMVLCPRKLVRALWLLIWQSDIGSLERDDVLDRQVFWEGGAEVLSESQAVWGSGRIPGLELDIMWACVWKSIWKSVHLDFHYSWHIVGPLQILINCVNGAK